MARSVSVLLRSRPEDGSPGPCPPTRLWRLITVRNSRVDEFICHEGSWLRGADGEMAPMAETANDLVLKCTAMARTGADFPTVWDAVLKGHALVGGLPIQSFDEELPQLEIQLINGQRLVYNQRPMNTPFCGLRPAGHSSSSPK
jgi:hypothetical protein